MILKIELPCKLLDSRRYIRARKPLPCVFLELVQIAKIDLLLRVELLKPYLPKEKWKYFLLLTSYILILLTNLLMINLPILASRGLIWLPLQRPKYPLKVKKQILPILNREQFLEIWTPYQWKERQIFSGINIQILFVNHKMKEPMCENVLKILLNCHITDQNPCQLIPNDYVAIKDKPYIKKHPFRPENLIVHHMHHISAAVNDIVDKQILWLRESDENFVVSFSEFLSQWE